jgi:hypothetical protein
MLGVQTFSVRTTGTFQAGFTAKRRALSHVVANSVERVSRPVQCKQQQLSTTTGEANFEGLESGPGIAINFPSVGPR